MSRVALLVILTLVMLITGCQSSSETPGETSSTTPVEGDWAGNLAPDFRLQNLEGQTVSLGDLRGSPVMLNFWATWCGPCRYEMPYLQQVYEEWSGKGLVLLAIDIGENPSLVKGFLEMNNLDLPVLLDTEKNVAEEYDIRGIPTTFFVDKDGIIQEKIVGSFPSKEAIEGHLAKIMQ